MKVGDMAKTLSDRFGKVLHKRQSMTINRNDKSTSISNQIFKCPLFSGHLKIK